METGAVPDAEFVFKWDGEKRGYEVWNQDLNLAQAIEYSAVWVYQEIARKVGKKNMQYWMDQCQYGNQSIDGDIDTFWLEGGIRISANQQIEFLEKLARNDLPFSDRSMSIVDSIMVREQTESYVLRAKTGWALRPERQIGWYVGWLEEGGSVFIFALNIDIKSNKDVEARQKITKEILKSEGLLKE